jgi:hypothetical protein
MRSLILATTSSAALLFMPLLAQAPLAGNVSLFHGLETQSASEMVVQVRHTVRHRVRSGRKPAHERLREQPRQPNGTPANAPPQGKQEG